MVASILGFMMDYYTSQSFHYGKYKFTRTDTGFSTVIDKKDVSFDFLPQDVNLTDFDNAVVDRIKSTKMFYMTYDLNSSNALTLGRVSYETAITLGNFNVFVQPAFTNLSKFNLPVVTCANATPFVPVVYFKDSNQTRAYMDSDCIVLESVSDVDFLRLKDRLLYGFFGIIS